VNSISLWIGKSIFLALKLLGRRGAALPGLVVERLASNFLHANLSELPAGVIIVVGTNGKTTTTKMLSHMLRGQHRVLTNPTGSNFTRGIVASIVEHASWGGHLPYDIAVLELDEAYAIKFIELHKPRGVVVLNVMRDQMDRFAEIDQTAKMLTRVAQAASDFVVLNVDDSRIAAIGHSLSSNVYSFGVSAELRQTFLQDDELYSGAKSTANNNVTVQLQSYADGQATYNIDNDSFTVELASLGAHNAQNAAAALATCQALSCDLSDVILRLSEVRPAFGRGELFQIGDKKVLLQLVKNPGGFRHSLLSAASQNTQSTMIAINDDYPDGRDVSWLWDVDFDSLQGGEIVTSGVRAADMALRLKYDDITVESIATDLNTCLQSFVANMRPGASGTIFATYTAMLELRRHMATLTEVEKV
jgi:UDP-N-acetylmuramyl tripeptide synthase